MTEEGKRKSGELAALPPDALVIGAIKKLPWNGTRRVICGRGAGKEEKREKAHKGEQEFRALRATIKKKERASLSRILGITVYQSPSSFFFLSFSSSSSSLFLAACHPLRAFSAIDLYSQPAIAWASIAILPYLELLDRDIGREEDVHIAIALHIPHAQLHVGGSGGDIASKEENDCESCC